MFPSDFFPSVFPYFPVDFLPEEPAAINNLDVEIADRAKYIVTVSDHAKYTIALSDRTRGP